MANIYYTAIVFFEDNSPVRKYRNISNLANFVRFLNSINAHYCNLYYKDSGEYYRRIYVQ